MNQEERPSGVIPASSLAASPSDDLEALTDDEAERMFLGTALRHAPGLREAADAACADLAAAGATEDEIRQALLVLARDAVLPPELEASGGAATR